MQLSNQDLSQIDEDELLNLPEEELRYLSIKLLNDLKEARERLSQNPRNSSRPSSKEAPWDKANDSEKETTDKQAEPEESAKAPPSKKSKPPAAENKNTSKPGKQPSTQGFGRTQKLAITDEKNHYPGICDCCHQVLNAQDAVAYAAYETIDIEWANVAHPGIHLTNTKHRLFEISCIQGHITRAQVSRTSPVQLPDIIRTEWRLVGPGLAAMIICLAYRMRLSRARIQEFLFDWLGLELSIGTINNTLHESGAAAIPLEDQFMQEIVQSELLHVDESSWMEHTTLLWLWVFSTDRITAYWIATRSAELMNNLLGENYSGWLMSDGYAVYRKYLSRLRCWAHLLRKAEGLKESLNQDAQLFGQQTLDLLGELINAVRKAREMPPDTPLSEAYSLQLLLYQQICRQLQSHEHKKTAALAKEMLNDWEAIFQVLDQPHHPLTNNEAERALRHWVILRGICYGTRSENGARVLAILISVIETCRKRNQSPWIYLAQVVASQRSGLPVPALPNVRVSE